MPASLRAILVVLGSSGCGSIMEAPPPPARAVAPSNHDIQLHMHEANVGLLRVQGTLLRGDLATARQLASAYVEAPDEPGLEPWAPYAASVRIQAKRLVSASNLDVAMHEFAMLGATCGACHEASHATMPRTVTPPLPQASEDLDARMTRHRWGVDELWAAVVAGDSPRWRSALEVLAADPIAWPDMTLEQRRYGGQLRALAQSSLAVDARLDVNGVAVQAYGDLLATCVNCHSAERGIGNAGLR